MDEENKSKGESSAGMEGEVCVFDPSRYFIGRPAGGGGKRERAREPEPLMECSHLLDPMAVSGRKAGDR